MANLFDSASLLLVATAFKTSKAYSVIPTDGDGDFTFARTDTSTRTTSDGTGSVAVAANVPALHYGTAGDPETCPSFRVENSTAAASFTLSNIVSNSILTGTAGTLMLEGKLPDSVTGFIDIGLSSDFNNNRLRTLNTGFSVVQGGSVVSSDGTIFDSDGTHIVTRIAVSWSGAGTAASATPTILMSQNGATKTHSITEWSDASYFDEIRITGKSTDDSDEIKVFALWDTALTQTELNTITNAG
jgi:hypothetical protein